MKTESEQVQRWDDIIFENRNKAYGAYTIRKSYDDNVLTGWVMSLGVVVVIFFSSFLKQEEVITTGKEDKGFVFPSPPPVIAPNLKVQPPPAPPKLPTNTNLPPVAVVDDVPDQPVEPVAPSALNGTEGTGTPTTGVIPSSGSDIGVPMVPPEPPYMLAPEVMPTYEGGMNELMKFLQKKMHYPRKARERRDEGTVFVSFIISSTGEVTDVEIIKGFNVECDKEAARVISMMDRWSPGLQNKMPVAVKMVLPIKFKLDN